MALSLIAGALGGGIFATAAVNIIGGLALNALSSALFAPEVETPESKVEIQVRQGVLPRSFIVGRAATAGSLVYHNTMGVQEGANGNDDENENLVQIIALSDLPVQGLTRMWIDGVDCTIDGSAGVDPIHGTRIPELADEDGQIKGWFRFYDGTQTVADQYVIDRCSEPGREWTANHILTGMAYIVLTFDYDPTVYQGRPTCLFEMDGIPITDPANGTNSYRQPAAQIYRLCQGIYYEGKWLYGPQTGVPLDFGTSIADCRAQVPGATGWTNAQKIAAFGSTTVPSRYRTGMEVRVDRPTDETIQDLASGCNGRFSEVAGTFRFQVGDPTATPDFTFTDDDLITTREHSFSPFFPLAETVNAVTATYPDPEQLYEDQEAPPLYVPAYEAEDGNRRLTTTVRLDAVPHKEQVQRLMKSALDEARRARRHSIVMRSKFWVVEPGDYGMWTSARNGYIDKMFRVDGVTDEDNGDVMLDITEVDPSDYDFDAGDFTPVVSGTVLPKPPPAYVLPGFTATAILIRDEQGVYRRAGIRINWNINRPGKGVIYEVYRGSTDEIVADGSTSDYKRGKHVISNGILAETRYEVRARRVTINGTAPWSARLSVTTGQVASESIDQSDIDDIIAAVEGNSRQVAEEVLGEYDEGVLGPQFEGHTLRDIDLLLDEYQGRVNAKGELAEVRDNLSSAIVEAGVAEASKRVELAAIVGSTRSLLVSEQLVRASADSAISQDVLALSAELIGETNARATAIGGVTARVDNIDGEITAISQFLDTAETEIGENTASISGQLASINGIKATVSFKINNNGHISGMGLMSEVINGEPVSKFAVVANQFVLAAPNGATQEDFFAFYTTPTVIAGETYLGGYSQRFVIGEARVKTLMIGDQAVTIDDYAFSANPPNVDDTSRIIISKTVNRYSGKGTSIDFNIDGYTTDIADGTLIQLLTQIYRGGTLIENKSSTFRVWKGGPTAAHYLTGGGLNTKDTDGGGATATYSVRMQVTSPSGLSGSFEVNNARLRIATTKR